MSSADDLAVEITEAMIAAIEAGAPDWRMPWHRMAVASCNPTGRPYGGINAVWLALLAQAKGYDSNVWGTYKAWQEAGAQVRKGARSEQVFLFTRAQSRTEVDAEGNPKTFLLAKTFRVFAAEQCDGSADVVARRRADRPVLDSPEAIDAADAWFERLGATVRHGGDRAFYAPAWDAITLPPLAQFRTAAHYYGTRAHESVHWTGHASRCNRDLRGRFGDDAYAAEELVAELGAAMWCAAAGVSQVTRDDHVGYLAGWLRVLRADPKHLRTIAARAQAAIGWMVERAGEITPVGVAG